MDESIDDFTQKYKDAYVWLNLKGDLILTKFVGLTETALLFQQPDIGDIRIKFEQAKRSIKTRFPKRGLYNLLDGCVFFYRIPQRQFKQSPCNGNCTMEQLGIPNAIHQINFDNLVSCFNPVYPKTKQQAIKLINEQGAVALSSKIGLTMSDNADYDLWYHNNLIGSITNSQVTVSYEPLRQEVIDHFGEDLVWKN